MSSPVQLASKVTIERNTADNDDVVLNVFIPLMNKEHIARSAVLEAMGPNC